MDSAMAAAVSGLRAQSSNLATISNNLANSSTTGYKAVNTQFLNLLTSEGSANQYPSGGVQAIARQAVGAQGTITGTTTTTDLAIDGSGLFAVQYGLTSSTNPYARISYTRNGAFSPDSSGNLLLSGTSYYLMGWKLTNNTITSANPDDVSSLSVVNINQYNTSAGASTYYSLKAVLPAEAPVGAATTQFTTSMQVYDSLGVAQIFPVGWEKTASNVWKMTISNPTNTSGVTSGSLADVTGAAATSTSYTVTFNSDGTLASVVAGLASTGAASPTENISGNSWPSIFVASYNDGATATTAANRAAALVSSTTKTPGCIALQLGQTGDTAGSLTQYDTGETVPTVQVKNTATDGVQFGEMTGVSVDSQGNVVVAYSNNQTANIYKIPVVTFNNEDGLSAKSDGIFAQNSTSGNAILNYASQNGTGKIDGQSLEASTVDTSTEFSSMIVAQQAYSAASQVIGTDKQMFQSLLDQMR